MKSSRTIMLILVFLSLVSLASVAAFYQCLKCGNLNVPYPLSTSDTCGDPKYKIYCKNGNLEFLSADGFYYKITSINPYVNRLVINPPVIEADTCRSSDLTLGGFRIDENTPFNISSSNTVMLLNCSENILQSPLNCSSNSVCKQFEEKGIGGRGCRNTLCCSYLKDASMTSHRIRVRVGGCTAYTSVVDIKPGDSIDTWHFGIELQWFPSTYWRLHKNL